MSNRRIRQLLTSLACLPAMMATQGCEGDTQQAPALPPPRPAEVAAAQIAAAPAAPEATSTNMITEIDRHPFAATSRDPFTPPPPRVEGPTGNGNQPVIAPDCDLEIDPLGETPLSRLTLQGLMTGTPVPRAMFTTPSLPQAVFVTEGAKVGPRCGYRLIDIRDNEVVFEEMTSVEEVRTQTVLTLNANRIDEAEFTNR